MSSNINPNNIDGSYPVAGQDNNSQGFRDNFTNIKTNFQYAENEINDLQNKVILKAALTGTTLDNDMAGSPLIDAQIQDFSATRVALGSLSGSVAINYASGHYQTVTTNGSISLSFTNFPAAGAQGWVIVRVTVSNTAHTLTLPAVVGTGASAKSIQGIQGISGQVITFAATGTYEFLFHTDDGGTTVYLSELTRPRNYFTNGITVASGNMSIGSITTTSEDLASGGTVSANVTASYFTTTSAEVANLGAGTAGQIKTLAMIGDGGDMVITVTNPAWSGSGTITFSAVGQGCTLQYLNSKWVCIGNNGATFA